MTLSTAASTHMPVPNRPPGQPLVPGCEWVPTLHDVYDAQEVVARFLPPTPLLRPAALAERLGFDVYVKCENLQPTGAFKVRGGLNLFNTMPAEIRERGVVTASTGNHGQSIAYAGREFGVRVRVFVPEGANPGKVAAIRRMGGEVVIAGLDFAGSCTAAEETADREGAYLIHPANEPALIAGVATYVLEILDAVPDLDVLFVPVGGGSGACGAVIAGKGTSAKLKVVAVQSLGAPAAFESWRRRELLTLEQMDTFADGMATRVAFALPAQILWPGLDDFQLVSDSELRRTILTLLETTGQLAEGAGAAALAAAYALRAQLIGQKVGVVITGGNLTLDGLRQAMNEERAW